MMIVKTIVKINLVPVCVFIRVSMRGVGESVKGRIVYNVVPSFDFFVGNKNCFRFSFFSLKIFSKVNV